MTCDHLIDEQIFRVLHGGLYEHFIDRDYAEVPDLVAPSAKYVAIAGDNLLHLVRPMGSQRILRRPKGWERHENDDDLSKVIAANDNFLLVRQTAQTGIDLVKRGLSSAKSASMKFWPSPSAQRQFFASISRQPCCLVNTVTPARGRKPSACVGCRLRHKAELRCRCADCRRYHFCSKQCLSKYESDTERRMSRIREWTEFLAQKN